MPRRAHVVLAAAYSAALAAVTAPACSTREAACPDFDDCEAAAECPVVRCLCGAGEVTSPPTCREDGTCTTTVDCAEVCGASGCASPPADCLAFVATECACGGGTPRFAAAWDCVEGAVEPPSALDCDQACGASSSTGTSTGTSGSSSTSGASP